MPTFGNLAEGTVADTNWRGFHGASPFTLTEDAVVSSLTGWVKHVGAGTQTFRFAIWADAAGEPGARLAVTADTSHVYTTGVDQQFTLAIAVPPTLTAGTYHLGMAFDDNSGSGANADLLMVSGGSYKYKSPGTADNPFGSPVTTNATRGFPIYATYAVVGYPYIDLVPSYDVDNVFNKWVGTRTEGEPQVWEDTASQEAYGLRTKQISSLVTTDGEVLNQVQWKSGIFAQPMNRVESITIMPLTDLTNTAKIDAGVAREVGDRITILETPPGFSTAQSNDYVIQQLAGQVDVGPLTSMKLSFLTWPANTVSFWIAGDAEQSRAGISTRPGY